MREKILVVDDQLDAGTILKLAMEAMGHDVRLAICGEEAMGLIETFIPDVVLCDINMPGLSGYDVCERMKKDPRLARTLFVAQTGLSTSESKERSRQAGFQHHLVKPIDINALLELVFFEKMSYLAVASN